MEYYHLGSITSEDKLSKNQEYAEEVLSLMGEYIPKINELLYYGLEIEEEE